MSTAIMQPTYLPWSGYFNLIGRVSTFVFLDDVQFAKPSWQMRNRILHRGEAFFLSVPTQGSRHQLLRDVRVAGDEFRGSHARTLEHTYRKHTHGADILDALLPILQDNSLERLVDLNVALIQRLAIGLGFAPTFLRSSDLGAEGKRSFHLLEILEGLGETHYFSPLGSLEYITTEQAFARSNISVEYQNFEAGPYTQRGASVFVPQLSLVDVVANLGFTLARRYVLDPKAFSENAHQTSTRISREDPLLGLAHP